jgi:hypothetical protein
MVKNRVSFRVKMKTKIRKIAYPKIFNDKWFHPMIENLSYNKKQTLALRIPIDYSRYPSTIFLALEDDYMFRSEGKW